MPLAVCGALSDPQLPGFWHVKVQSTPALLESLLTTAVRFSEKLTASDGEGSG